MKFSLIGGRAALVGLMCASGTVAGADCRPLLVAPVMFCADGTSWQDFPLVPEVKDNVITVMAAYGPEAVLVFSRIPKDDAANLPRRPRHKHIVEVLGDFSELISTYSGAVEMDRFSPLGEDVAVASLAAHDVKNDWMNIYTYYAIGDARLVVQTGVSGATELTGRHRALHLEALGALAELKL